MDAAHLFHSTLQPTQLARLYRSVRDHTARLAAPLSDADATVQSMPDASPAKWHLAHTTWFFETMVLVPHLSGYRPFDDVFNFLFNSYYESVGARQPRPSRGMLTRPSLQTVLGYREHVDAAIHTLFERSLSGGAAELMELGCHHEQQHQELLLTDILHLFAQNPLQPTYKAPEPLPVESRPSSQPNYIDFEGGLLTVGHSGDGFAFDCEGPRHQVFIEPFRLADRLVTNGEWIEFIADGGYRNRCYGCQRDGPGAGRSLVGPLVLGKARQRIFDHDLARSSTAGPGGACHPCKLLRSRCVRNLARPAFADGVGVGSRRHHCGAGRQFFRLRTAAPEARSDDGGMKQMFGDVWEWTRSAFLPYPRFVAAQGAIGEYNGKFMSGQFVLRGGSCVTPADHIRSSYRNFFPPETRWQFSGLRLAEGFTCFTSTFALNNPKPSSPMFVVGLAQMPKTLPSRWFYDDRGCELFEDITKLEEYYPTRVETTILRKHSGEMAAFCGAGRDAPRIRCRRRNQDRDSYQRNAFTAPVCAHRHRRRLSGSNRRAFSLAIPEPSKQAYCGRLHLIICTANLVPVGARVAFSPAPPSATWTAER